MAGKDRELYDLIKSMTPAEKGYFVKYAASVPARNDGRYMELFRAMDGLMVYDENMLRHTLGRFSEHGQPHRVRHYLYHLLLECLEHYHRGKLPSDQIMVLIRRARLLSSRQLPAQANALLQKACALCRKHSQDSLIRVALKMMNDNLIMMGKDVGDAQVQSGIEEVCSVARRNLHNELAYRAYTRMMGRYRQHGTAQDEEEEAAYRSLYHEITSEISDGHLDMAGLIYLMHARYLLGLCTSDTDMAIGGLESALDIVKVGEARSSSQVLASLCRNLHELYVRNGRYWHAERLTCFLEEWVREREHALTPASYSGLMDSVNLQRLALMAHDPSRLGDLPAYRDIEAYLKGRDLTPHVSVSFHLTAMAHCLYRSAYREALGHCNALMNVPESRDYDISARLEGELLGLIIHLGLGNHDLLESLVTSFRRRLRGHRVPLFADFAEKLAYILSKFPDVNTVSQRIEWKRKVIVMLEHYCAAHPERYRMLEFDYLRYFREVF